MVQYHTFIISMWFDQNSNTWSTNPKKDSTLKGSQKGVFLVQIPQPKVDGSTSPMGIANKTSLGFANSTKNQKSKLKYNSNDIQ